MKRYFSFNHNLIFIFITIMLSACNRSQNAPSELNVSITDYVSPTSQNTPTGFPTIESPEPRSTARPSLAALQGPVFLLQTKVDEYYLIDLSTLAKFSFELPGQFPLDSLPAYQSPGNQSLLYPIDEEHFIVIDILSNQFRSFSFSEDIPSNFDFDLAVKSIQEMLPNQFMTYDGARFAVEESLRKSKQRIKWFQDDENILLVQENGTNGTYLFSYNIINETSKQLEDIPGLIENFWVSPGGEKILLKKGIVSQPNIWQDDQYLILSPSLDEVEILPMPQNTSNPSVFWISNDSIGVIHQQTFAANEFFSIINLSDMKSNLIVPTSFSSIKSFNAHFLSTQTNQETGSTTIKLWQMNGEIVKSRVVQDICNFKSKVDSQRALINCSQESFLVEGNELTLFPLIGRISIFSRSPNRDNFILVTDTHQTYLVDPTFEYWRTIETEGDPLEVRWLPNSSGFLYRTATDLYHFDLISGNNRYVLTSDLFADYINLNLIWITQ